MTTNEEAASFAAYDAISETIAKYVDGARVANTGLMRSAFSEAATVRGSYSGKPVDWTLQEFCDVIEKGGPAPELDARVVTVEISGTAAMARLEAQNWRGTRYTDFFVLLNRDGKWWITSKVFFAHARA